MQTMMCTNTLTLMTEYDELCDEMKMILLSQDLTGADLWRHEQTLEDMSSGGAWGDFLITWSSCENDSLTPTTVWQWLVDDIDSASMT